MMDTMPKDAQGPTLKLIPDFFSRNDNKKAKKGKKEKRSLHKAGWQKGQNASENG